MTEIARGRELGEGARLGDERPHIVQERGAGGARRRVRVHRRAGGGARRLVDVVAEPLGELLAGQRARVHRFSASRKSRRARCSCALHAPEVTPNISAISSCLYPSMSWSTNTRRAPGGSFSIACS